MVEPVETRAAGENASSDPRDLTRLRIYIGEDDTYADEHGREQPLYEAIAERARALGIDGLTVARGIVGFGPGSRREKILLRRSEDRPIMIDIVDTEGGIERFLRVIEGMIGSGLAVTERVTARRYGSR